MMVRASPTAVFYLLIRGVMKSAISVLVMVVVGSMEHEFGIITMRMIIVIAVMIMKVVVSMGQEIVLITMRMFFGIHVIKAKMMVTVMVAPIASMAVAVVVFEVPVP